MRPTIPTATAGRSEGAMDNLSLMALAGGGYSDGSLTNEEALKIQEKLWRFLARRTELYTMGDSSSVPAETAGELLNSICFTLSLCLKESGSPASLLASADLEELFARGVRATEKQVERGKLLWQAACVSVPKIDNISLRDTLRGIGGFFKRYDHRFFAHQIPCDIDYQLCRAVPDELHGIEYLNEYLSRIIIENDFLRKFDERLVIRLLKSYCPDYKGLLINLYEPAAVNAAGLALTGGDVFSLDITDADRARLSALLAGLPESSARKALSDCAGRLYRAVDIGDAAAREYLTQTALGLWPRIAAALPSGKLDGIFLSIASDESNDI
ncbi:hypothetical protein SDC9_57302 [bioreactor metagenome]|uniref:Uncharacterized protein n=1 Tax=bioreactor metagenome TaxID=1076179 RepID=A0A644XA25_9ZZZZ